DQPTAYGDYAFVNKVLMLLRLVTAGAEIRPVRNGYRAACRNGPGFDVVVGLPHEFQDDRVPPIIEMGREHPQPLPSADIAPSAIDRQAQRRANGIPRAVDVQPVEVPQASPR